MLLSLKIAFISKPEKKRFSRVSFLCYPAPDWKHYQRDNRVESPAKRSEKPGSSFLLSKVFVFSKEQSRKRNSGLTPRQSRNCWHSISISRSQQWIGELFMMPCRKLSPTVTTSTGARASEQNYRIACSTFLLIRKGVKGHGNHEQTPAKHFVERRSGE